MLQKLKQTTPFHVTHISKFFILHISLTRSVYFLLGFSSSGKVIRRKFSGLVVEINSVFHKQINSTLSHSSFSSHNSFHLWDAVLVTHIKKIHKLFNNEVFETCKFHICIFYCHLNLNLSFFLLFKCWIWIVFKLFFSVFMKI